MLLEHGHPEAFNYPVGLLTDEVLLVMQRLNRMEATRALLLQMAVSTILSKEAGAEFEKVIGRLTQE